MSVSPSSWARPAMDGRVGQRKVGESNPIQPRFQGSWLATRFLSQFGYLPYVLQWTDRELNPDFRHARAVSSHWTISPLFSGPHGSRTHRTDLARVSRPQRHAGPSSRGPSGNRTRSPSLPRTCAAGTPTDQCASDPGWNRTSTFLHVTQASSPLDHGIIQ